MQRDLNQVPLPPEFMLLPPRPEGSAFLSGGGVRALIYSFVTCAYAEGILPSHLRVVFPLLHVLTLRVMPGPVPSGSDAFIVYSSQEPCEYCYTGMILVHILQIRRVIFRESK